MRAVLEAPYSDYAQWMRHYERYPPGDWRTHRLLATLIAVLCNVNRDPKSNPHPYYPWDFAPELMTEEHKEERREREMERIKETQEADVERILKAMESKRA